MSFAGGQFSEGSRVASNNLRRRGLHTICTALSEKLNGESSSIMELNPATMNLGSVEGRVITSVSHGTTNAPVVLAAALSNIAEHSYAAKPTASNGSKAGKTNANGHDPSSSSSSDSSSSDSEAEEVATREVASGPTKAIITVASPVNTEGQFKSTPRLRSQPVKYVDEMKKFQGGGSSGKGTSTPSTAQQKATPKTGGASTSKGRPAKATRQTPAGDVEKKKPETEQRRRGRGCGQCEGCLREDCGTCTFCRDKPKFGGPGTKKQKCALRVCSNFVKKVVGSGHVRTDTPTTNSSMTVDLRSFINKTPSTAGTTPTSAVTAPTVTAGGTPTTTKSTQAPKVVAKVLSKSSAAVSSPKQAAGASTSAQQTSASPKKGDNAISEATMKCVQCGRERKVGMARTDKFCTQRCIINWLEAHPEKSVDDAMGVVSSPEAPLSIANVQSLSSSPAAKKEAQKESGSGGGKQKPVSRALKNLQIDMALPGTKLAQHGGDEESDEEEEGRSRKRPRVSSSQLQQLKFPVVGTRSTRRGVQISPTKPVKSATSTPVATAKTSASGTGKKFTQSSAGQPSGSGVSGKATAASTSVKSTPVVTGGNIKRMLSASAPHPPALKKAKTGGGGGGTPSKPSSSSGAGPKAVTFNLGFVQSSQKGQPTPTFSLVPIDQLSAPLGGTLVNQQDSHVTVPDELSPNVRSWSMDDVMKYFQSTTDCKDFCDIFAEQEVDGTALLLLTHEALVKCLGIKLGRAVKIMAHVEALKRFYEKSQ